MKKEIDQLEQDFYEGFAASRDRFEKDRAAEKRFGRWIATVFLIPCFVLACGVTFMLIHGLAVGDTIGGTRFIRTMYSLAEQPFQYWISVVVHAGLVASMWGLTAFAWRHSRWCNR